MELSYGGTLSKPTHTRRVSAAALQNARKWTGLAANGLKETREGLRIPYFFAAVRGLATGDNRFFILSRTEIEERELPFELFKPILPGPRHLLTDVIDAEEDGTPKIERQLFILDCRLEEDALRRRFRCSGPTSKPASRGCQTPYSCSRRTPTPGKPAACAVRLHVHGTESREARETFPIYF